MIGIVKYFFLYVPVHIYSGRVKCSGSWIGSIHRLTRIPEARDHVTVYYSAVDINSRVSLRLFSLSSLQLPHYVINGVPAQYQMSV